MALEVTTEGIGEMNANQDTIGRQARIAARGRRMGQVNEDEAGELVRHIGAVQHAMLEIQQGMFRALIGAGVISGEDAAVSMTGVIDQLETHAALFEETGGPAPDTLRAIADSLRGDVDRYLKQGQG